MLHHTRRGRRSRHSTTSQFLVEPIERRVLLATITVTTLADGGVGSLRQAILDANDEINFPGADTIDFSVSGTITSTGEMAITSPITISGPGAALLAVSGGGAVRLFSTSGAPTGTAVTISGLTLRDGRSTTGAAVQVGDEAFTIRDCVVTANVGTSTGGAVTVATVGGTITVDACTFSGNSSTAGGGITGLSGTGMLVTNSTFTQNVTTIGNTGGAIRFVGAVGAFGVNIRNCTISDNQSGFNGGGVGFGTNFTGTANIQNCTITNNRAVNLGGGGGVGINNTTGTTGTVILESCIISGNVVTGTGTGPDLFNGTASQIVANFCAIGTSTGASNFVPDATTTALLGQNFNLAPLGNNGGPTQTHALQSPSPAIDNGSNPAGLVFDQRGTGFPRVVGARADIGAVEAAAAVPPTVSNSQFNYLTSQSVVVTFSENVTFPSGINAAFAVQNLTTNTPVSFSAQQTGNVVTLTFPAILDDADFRATVIAANVMGAGGAMSANHVLDFFFLNGDADRNRTVNLNDFNIVAANFGQSPRDFSQGDFNYDSLVNLLDFNVLAGRFGVVLASPSAAGLSDIFGRQSIAKDDPLSDILA